MKILFLLILILTPVLCEEVIQVTAQIVESQVLSIPPTDDSGSGGGGGGPGMGGSYSASGQTLQIRFPVVSERFPGEEVTIEFVIENNGTSNLSFNPKIEGIPNDWVEITPSSLNVLPDEKGSITISIRIPSDAEAKNYEVKTALDTTKNLDPFLLRVISRPEKYGIPVSSREVEYNTYTNRSIVRLRIVNGENEGMVRVREQIPKKIAQNVNLVKFSIPPTRIIEKDPVIEWDLESLEAFEVRTLSYEVPGVINYNNWPEVRNWFTEEIYRVNNPEDQIKLEIEQVKIPVFTPGSTRDINVEVLNTGNQTADIEVQLIPPDNWISKSPVINTRIYPKDLTSLSFSVHAPYGSAPDSYRGSVRVLWPNGEIVVYDLFFVELPFKELDILLFALIIVLILAIFKTHVIDESIEFLRKTQQNKK